MQIVFETGFMDGVEQLDFRLSDAGLELLADGGGLFGVPVPDNQREFIAKLARGVYDNVNELDAKIEKHAEGWKVERVSRIAKAILRLAIYEIMSGETPAEIAINEAVELAKKFDADEASPAFINGILGAYVRDPA